MSTHSRQFCPGSTAHELDRLDGASLRGKRNPALTLINVRTCLCERSSECDHCRRQAIKVGDPFEREKQEARLASVRACRLCDFKAASTLPVKSFILVNMTTNIIQNIRNTKTIYIGSDQGDSIFRVITKLEIKEIRKIDNGQRN